jgi:hypothetical protein
MLDSLDHVQRWHNIPRYRSASSEIGLEHAEREMQAVLDDIEG